MEIPPVQHLNSVELVDPGKVTKIWGSAFTAGNCPYQVSVSFVLFLVVGIVLFLILDPNFTPFVFIVIYLNLNCYLEPSCLTPNLTGKNLVLN